MAKTVFVNGCFDILHPGHTRLLTFAASLGDSVVVAVDSDARVRAAKGDDRPIFTHSERAEMLLAFKGVIRAYIFDSDTELEGIVRWESPDIMVVGGDWRGKPIIGSEFATEVRYYDRIEKWSTTSVIEGWGGR